MPPNSFLQVSVANVFHDLVYCWKLPTKNERLVFEKQNKRKGKKKIIIVHEGHRRKTRECVHTVHYQHMCAQIHSWNIKPIFLLVYNLLLVLHFFFHLVIDPRESWYHSTTSKPYSSKILPALSKVSPHGLPNFGHIYPTNSPWVPSLLKTFVIFFSNGLTW